jgi:hypothetical protein
MAIRNLEEFRNSLPAGHDGVFDWDWVKGLLPRGIEPMDIDGLVEIGGHFLIWETKTSGAEIPVGQKLALKRLVRLGDGRISLLYHAKKPEDLKDLWLLICRFGHLESWVNRLGGLEKARTFVFRWGQYADAAQQLPVSELRLQGWDKCDRNNR